MVVIICGKYGNNRSRTENVTERTRFSKSRSNDLEDMSRSKVITCDTPSHASDHLYQIWKESIQNCRRYRADTIFKSRSNDLEDIGQGQRSSHATHLLMLVIICIKYGKNPSRTVDATERTRFSRPRPNDLEDIGQGQRSLYATHSLIPVIICIKYGKNPSRTVEIFFKFAKNSNFQILKKT